MTMFPEKMVPPNDIGATWLAKVKGDSRMAGEATALVVAGELARYIRHDGSGEMPSPDIARPIKLTEDAAIEGVNALIYRIFLPWCTVPGYGSRSCFLSTWTISAVDFGQSRQERRGREMKASSKSDQQRKAANALKQAKWRAAHPALHQQKNREWMRKKRARRKHGDQVCIPA